MNLLQLQYFQCVAKHQNFTKAAEELFVSQPALSQMIRKLEHELNTELFIRKGKQISLSKSGHIYLQYVNRALAALDEGKKALQTLSINRKTTISLGYSSKTEFIQLILLDYWKAHPEYIIQSELITPDCAIQRLITSKIDFALLHQKIEHPNISYYTISTHTIYLYLGYGHPLSNIKEISLLDLDQTPLLCNSHTIAPELLQTLCRDYGLDPNIHFIINDINTIQHIMNRAPYGYFVHSNVIARDFMEPQKTKGTFHLIQQELNTTNYLAIRNNFQISREQKQFLDYIQQEEARYDALSHEKVMSYMAKRYKS